MATVTVVMPAYNAGQYIAEALDSVIAQTYIDWECVVVNDGSTDDTLTILEQYSMKDSRIRHYSVSNSGSAKMPRDLAVAHAQTEWIIYLDADDYYENDVLERMIGRQKETDADIVCLNMVSFDYDGNIIIKLPSDKFDLTQVLPGKQALLLTLGEWIIPMGGALLRRKLYTNLSTYQTQRPHMNIDEYDSRELLIMADKVAFVGTNYYYRCNKESISNKVTYKKFEALITNKMLVGLVEKTFGKESREANAAEYVYLYSISGYWREFKELSPRMDDENRIKSYNIIKEHFKELKIKDVAKSSVSIKRKLTYLLPFGLFKLLESLK